MQEKPGHSSAQPKNVMKKKLSLQSTNYDSWLWPKKAQRPKKFTSHLGAHARGATDEDLKLLDGDAEAKLCGFFWGAPGGWSFAPGWCLVMNK